MGCITGFVAKIFLTAFNVVVALTGVAVLTLCAIVFGELKDYGGASDLLSDEANSVLTGLETISGFVICLGAFGVLVSCCCQNKLFLYTYFGLGICMVIIVLTFGIMGTNNFKQYSQEVKTNMTMKYVDGYNFDNASDPTNNEINELFSTKECCGVDGPGDYKQNDNNEVPLGCCENYPEQGDTCTYTDTPNGREGVWPTGCYNQLSEEIGEIAEATFSLGIFFGVLLLALVLSTCLCVKCTDAMPI